MTGTKLRIIETPHLTEIRGRAVSVSGWRHKAVIEHLLWHLEQPTQQWCSITCMARTFFQRNSESNQERVRKRASRLISQALRAEPPLLIVPQHSQQKHDHGKLIALTIFDSHAATLQREYARDMLEKMRQRGQLTQTLVERARAILDAAEKETT